MLSNNSFLSEVNCIYFRIPKKATLPCLNPIVHTIGNLESFSPLMVDLNQLKKDYNLFIFKGDLGLGKTTLIKHWLQNIGVNDPITSPTFSIINEYRLANEPIYHIDCYRLKTEEEALEIGIEEYLDGGQLCLIEWPELIINMLPLPYIGVSISSNENDIRTYKLEIVTA